MDDPNPSQRYVPGSIAVCEGGNVGALASGAAVVVASELAGLELDTLAGADEPQLVNSIVTAARPATALLPTAEPIPPVGRPRFTIA